MRNGFQFIEYPCVSGGKWWIALHDPWKFCANRHTLDFEGDLLLAVSRIIVIEGGENCQEKDSTSGSFEH